MTPTPEQLAAVLPRCMAGIDGGDWTEDDERLAWATRVLRYVELAAANELQRCDSGLDAVLSAGNPEGGTTGPRERQSGTERPQRRDPHEVLHGDTWEVRDGRATIVGSNDWPAPANAEEAK